MSCMAGCRMDPCGRTELRPRSVSSRLWYSINLHKNAMKDAPSIFAFLAITGDLPTFCFRLQIVALLCSSFFLNCCVSLISPPKEDWEKNVGSLVLGAKCQGYGWKC